MGLGFSNTFPLNRSLLDSALRILHAKPGIDDQDLAQEIGVGGRKGIGFSAWLLYTGLRNFRPKAISELGRLILHFDPYLTDISTQAVLHYQLCANPSATVWSLLSQQYIPQTSTFSREEITEFCISQGLGKHGSKNKHLVSDIGIFLRVYTSFEGLESLNYFYQQSNGNYCTGDISMKIHPLFVAFVIYSQRAKGVQVSTISIGSLLSDDSNVGKVFLMDRKILLEKLRQLEIEGFVKIAQEADLDNITYVSDRSPLEILRMYYEKG